MAEILPFLGSIGGAAIQSSAAGDAAAAQAGLTKEIYDADRQREYEAAQYLKDLLPNLNLSMPDPTKYLGSDSINRSFDISGGNLNRTALAQAAQSAGQSGALAASRGLANPTGFTSGAFQSTLGQFAPQFGALEANRASALNQGQSDLFRALMGNAQYQNAMRQQGYNNQFQLAQNFGNPNIAPTKINTQTNWQDDPRYASVQGNKYYTNPNQNYDPKKQWG